MQKKKYRKQPKQGGSNREKKTNSKCPLKTIWHNLARYFSLWTKIWWIWTTLWLPSETNHRGKTFVCLGFSLSSFLGSFRQSEVGNRRDVWQTILRMTQRSSHNCPSPALRRSAKHARLRWLLKDSGLKMEHLGFQGQAWIHAKFEQS